MLYQLSHKGLDADVAVVSITMHYRNSFRRVLEFKESRHSAHTILLATEAALETFRKSSKSQKKGAKLQISIPLDG